MTCEPDGRGSATGRTAHRAFQFSGPSPMFNEPADEPFELGELVFVTRVGYLAGMTWFELGLASDCRLVHPVLSNGLGEGIERGPVVLDDDVGVAR